MRFSITTPWSGSLALANARTVRPVILSTVSMNYAAVATWKNMRDSRTRCCSPISTILLSAGKSASSMTHSSASAPAKCGERFIDVEDVIDASDLAADEKSVLWLLAWSYVHPRAQRREAIAHLDRLTAATSPPATNRKRHLRIAG
jgi:hypothetical protein